MSKKRIAVGSDHAGYHYKRAIVEWLKEKGYPVEDFGAHSAESADYPDFAHPVADAVEGGKADLGVLVCGSGNGVCMTANKHAGVRAGLVWSSEVAELVRLHNDANVLCLPARFVSREVALDAVQTFLTTAFEGGRHQRRVDKIAEDQANNR